MSVFWIFFQKAGFSKVSDKRSELWGLLVSTKHHGGHCGAFLPAPIFIFNHKECLWHIRWISERWIQGDLHFTSPDISGMTVEECKSSGIFVQQATAARVEEKQNLQCYVQNCQWGTMLNLVFGTKSIQFHCATMTKECACAMAIKKKKKVDLCLLQKIS